MPKLLTEKKRDYEVDENEAQVELAIAEWEAAEPLEIPPKRKEDKPQPQAAPDSKKEVSNKRFGTRISFSIKTIKATIEQKKTSPKTDKRSH